MGIGAGRAAGHEVVYGILAFDVDRVAFGITVCAGVARRDRYLVGTVGHGDFPRPIFRRAVERVSQSGAPGLHVHQGVEPLVAILVPIPAVLREVQRCAGAGLDPAVDHAVALVGAGARAIRLAEVAEVAGWDVRLFIPGS